MPAPKQLSALDPKVGEVVHLEAKPLNIEAARATLENPPNIYVEIEISGQPLQRPKNSDEAIVFSFFTGDRPAIEFSSAEFFDLINRSGCSADLLKKIQTFSGLSGGRGGVFCGGKIPLNAINSFVAHFPGGEKKSVTGYSPLFASSDMVGIRLDF